MQTVEGVGRRGKGSGRGSGTFFTIRIGCTRGTLVHREIAVQWGHIPHGVSPEGRDGVWRVGRRGVHHKGVLVIAMGTVLGLWTKLLFSYGWQGGGGGGDWTHRPTFGNTPIPPIGLPKAPTHPWPSWGSHSGEKSIWLHNPCLLEVPVVGRNQCGCIIG